MPYPGMASVAVGNPQAVGITSGDRQRQWRHPCGIRSLRWPFAFLNLNAASEVNTRYHSVSDPSGCY